MSKLRLLKLAKSNRTGTALFGSASRVFALGAQFIVVLVLTRLFAKAEFGNFMIAFATYRVLATGVGTGLASVMLYHVPRSDAAGTEVRLHRAAILIGLVIAVVLCVGAWALADPIAIEVAKPGLAGWLRAMTPFLFFTLMSTITTGSYEGRNQVAMAIFFTEVAPNAVRLVLLGALPFTTLPDIWVAHIMALSIVVPWLISVRHLFDARIKGIQPFTAWDYGYAGKLTLYNFAAMQVQGVDMIVAGWLFSAENVADYAIASRIAALFPFFLQLRVRMFGPVAGKLLGAGDKDALQKEAWIAKDFATILVTLTVGGLLLASPIFLKLFWNSGTLAVMLVLMAFPPVYRALFAVGDRLLQVAGHANWNLGIMLSALAIVVGVPVLIGDRVGIMSLPIAMIASSFLLNPVIAFAARRTTGIRLLQPSDGAVILAAAACTAVPLIFFHAAGLMLCAGGLFVLLALVLASRYRVGRMAVRT